jgi:hypothetical protein
MTTLRITVDEPVAQAIRRKAELEGKTAEAWLADMAALQAVPAQSKEWIDRFLESARHRPGNSHGWKWNREELYER